MTSPEILIRPMTLDDLPQVRAIEIVSFSLPWPESAYRYELTQNPHSLLWVAETEQLDGEKTIAGMIVIWLVLDEAHIATIAVHPDYRRKGIGRGLLAVGLNQSVQRGANKALLEVRASNESAQYLYRQFGFEVVSRRPKYYRDNLEDALLMNVDGLGSAYTQELERRGWINGFPVATG